MEDVYSELDSVKAELEKLKAESQIKTQLFENLKKAHSKQSLKVEEAKQKVEEQSQELKVKYEEIADARQLLEKLEFCLQEKESSLRNLDSLNEKVKADLEQKLKTLEGDNKDLVFTLDELTTRNKELEQDVCANRKQNEGLKKLLLVAENKCSEAETMAQGAKELMQRDVAIIKLVEEKDKVQHKLKWKEEQFKHLEEAHNKLQDQFQMSKEDWKREKSALVEEICSLQTRLESQTRAVEGLQTRLEMCNNALAYEEGKRRSLEVKVSDFESRFQKVFAQFEEETSEIQRLTVERNEEILKLRNSLGMKEILAKEMELKILHLEQDNQELLGSLKELQEDQIRNAGPTSSAKLHKKLRRLEQAHSKCSVKLKEKETELLYLIEKIEKNVSSSKYELEGKEGEIKKLQMELESCNCTIQVLNEETSIILAVLKSELSEAYSTAYSVKVEMELFDKEKDDKISLLIAQLEMSCSALDTAHFELEEERKKVGSLTERVKSFELMQQRLLLREEELERHKNLFEESKGSQLHLKKLLGTERVLDDGKRDLSDALEKANAELAAKSNKVAQFECEADNWKYNSNSLNSCFGEDQETSSLSWNSFVQDETTEIFKNDRENLISVLRERERKLEDLLQQNVLLEGKLAAKAYEMETCLKDKESLARIAEEMEICIENLQKDVAMLKQESRRRELEAATLARFDAERDFTEEKEMLLRVITDKEQRRKNLKVLATSLERDLTSAVISSFSDAIEKQVKIDALTEALEKHKYVTDLEIEDKNKLIARLENEVCCLRQRLTQQENFFLSLKQEAAQLQALQESNKLEIEKFIDGQKRMEGILKQLESDKGRLLQDNTKLAVERESLLAYIEKICDGIGDFSSKDVEMMGTLGKLLPRYEEKIEPAMGLMVHDFYDSIGENADISFSTTTKKLEASSKERSPLKEVNSWQR